MNEPTDPEGQLRRILKEHAADSEDLLEQVKHDEYEAGYARGERVGRELGKNSLSALREAVGKFFDKLERAAGPHGGYDQRRFWEARDALRKAYDSAHDAAPAAPTLTLEEVDGAMRKGGVDPATARSVRGILEAKIRVAQKGAGRGDGK